MGWCEMLEEVIEERWKIEIDSAAPSSAQLQGCRYIQVQTSKYLIETYDPDSTVIKNRAELIQPLSSMAQKLSKSVSSTSLSYRKQQDLKKKC